MEKEKLNDGCLNLFLGGVLVFSICFILGVLDVLGLLDPILDKLRVP